MISYFFSPTSDTDCADLKHVLIPHGEEVEEVEEGDHQVEGAGHQVEEAGHQVEGAGHQALNDLEVSSSDDEQLNIDLPQLDGQGDKKGLCFVSRQYIMSQFIAVLSHTVLL